MNERRKTGKLSSIVNLLEKRFSGMNKGSKLIMKIARAVLPAALVGALFLIITNLTGLVRFDNQLMMVQWIITYSFRTWVLLICGALILDYLKGGDK
jgi:hypothetical protein